MCLFRAEEENTTLNSVKTRSLPCNICVFMSNENHQISVLLLPPHCKADTLFSRATCSSSAALKAKRSIFLGKTKDCVCFNSQNYFLSLSNIQVHWVAHLANQKQKLHSSCFGRERAQINPTIQDQRPLTWMCILFFGCFSPFECLRMGYEYSASGKILLSPLQYVKLKAIGGTQLFRPSNTERHRGRERECVRGMRDFVKRDRASEHVLEKESDRAW